MEHSEPKNLNQNNKFRRFTSDQLIPTSTHTHGEADIHVNTPITYMACSLGCFSLPAVAVASCFATCLHPSYSFFNTVCDLTDVVSVGNNPCSGFLCMHIKSLERCDPRIHC